MLYTQTLLQLLLFAQSDLITYVTMKRAISIIWCVVRSIKSLIRACSFTAPARSAPTENLFSRMRCSTDTMPARPDPNRNLSIAARTAPCGGLISYNQQQLALWRDVPIAKNLPLGLTAKLSMNSGKPFLPCGRMMRTCKPVPKE